MCYRSLVGKPIFPSPEFQPFGGGTGRPLRFEQLDKAKPVAPPVHIDGRVERRRQNSCVNSRQHRSRTRLDQAENSATPGRAPHKAGRPHRLNRLPLRQVPDQSAIPMAPRSRATLQLKHKQDARTARFIVRFAKKDRLSNYRDKIRQFILCSSINLCSASSFFSARSDHTKCLSQIPPPSGSASTLAARR